MQLRVWGSAVSSPSEVWEEPQPKSKLVHFSLKIWRLVTTISIILTRINWPVFHAARFPGLGEFRISEGDSPLPGCMPRINTAVERRLTNRICFVTVLLFKIWFYAFIRLYFSMFFWFSFTVRFIVTVVLCTACTFVTCSNEDRPFSHFIPQQHFSRSDCRYFT